MKFGFSSLEMYKKNYLGEIELVVDSLRPMSTNSINRVTSLIAPL